MRLEPRTLLSYWNFAATLAILSLLSSKHCAWGYAAWLKCFVELDPSEVVMNQYIISHENAEYKGIELEVRADGDDQWTVDQYLYTLPNQKLEVRLRLPEVVKNTFDAARREVQWVLETSPGAEVVSSPLCDGRRGYSMRHDEVIVLKIGSKEGSEQQPETVELVAGWASGHEAVTLTNRLRLSKKLNKEEEL